MSEVLAQQQQQPGTPRAGRIPQPVASTPQAALSRYLVGPGTAMIKSALKHLRRNLEGNLFSDRKQAH